MDYLSPEMVSSSAPLFLVRSQGVREGTYRDRGFVEDDDDDDVVVL